MLDTILRIGRVLRTAPDGLRHHRYVKPAPPGDAERNPVRFWLVPAQMDGSFDFGGREPLDDENRQGRLFYLNYKSSDSDSSKRYIFGDIYRSYVEKDGKKQGEAGNYILLAPRAEGGTEPAKLRWSDVSSFDRANEGTNPISTARVAEFRKCFENQKAAIEAFLREESTIRLVTRQEGGRRRRSLQGHGAYLHFDFGGRGWHELEEMEILNRSLLDSFYERTDRGYLMRGFLFKTLAADLSKIPGFAAQGRFKARVFADEDEAMDLIYAINYASTPIVRRGDLKIIVLPRSESLTATQVERFFDRRSSQEPDADTEAAEAEVRHEAEVSGRSSAAAAESAATAGSDEELFSFLMDDEATGDIAQFDFVFSKAGGTKSDVDMVELAGLQRSKLSHIRKRVEKERVKVEGEREDFYLRMFGRPPKKALPALRVTQSFLNLLGDTTRAKAKYQSHLLKVLPQIYTDSYAHDPMLLRGLVEKTEFSVRNDVRPYFNELKFDFFFLTSIQINGEDRLMEMQSFQSYRIGMLLGKLAKQFSGPNSPIKSFEKNYVGLLSRRISTLPDVVRLANDVNQKLVMHELSGYTFRTASELATTIKDFSGRYDKDECAFGFFEAYFAPLPRKGGDGEGADNRVPEADETQPALDMQSAE